MSFSAEVKEELAEMVPSEFSLFTAELQGLLLYGAKLTEKEGGTELRFLSEHEESAKKYFTFIRKTDRIKTDFAITTQHPTPPCSLRAPRSTMKTGSCRSAEKQSRNSPERRSDAHFCGAPFSRRGLFPIPSVFIIWSLSVRMKTRLGI